MNIRFDFGLPTILLVIFVTLKLAGVITWSWIWVLAPLWIPVIIAIVIIAVTLTIYFVNKYFK